MLRYRDAVLIAIGGTIPVPVGVPPAGYGVSAARWIAPRGLGRVVDRHALAIGEPSRRMALRVGYRLVRVALLVLAVVRAETWTRKHDGVAALLVIVFGFTTELGRSIAHDGVPLARDRALRSGGGER
jgi:hypothetical protein